MAEETKDKQSSPQSASEEEKKPVIPPAPSPRPQVQVPTPQATAQPPPPKPAVPPPPAAASRQQVPKDSGRRTLVKALFTVGAILAIVPFVPWGRFLSSSITGSGKRTLLQKAVVDSLPKYGAAAGKPVNVNDLTTFPPNSHWVITYPSSGDLVLDAQNPDTFVKYDLIRLPTELGGGSKKATDFVAFSQVCVHLWCSPNYNPTQISNPQENGYLDPNNVKPGSVPPTKHQQYECPCHGSIYEVPTGKAVKGPAALQAAPTNAIPMLTLQNDSEGNLYIYYPNRDPSKPFPSDQVSSIGANGELGYGRDFKSYQNFIKPMGELQADPAGLTVEVKS